MKIVEGRLIQEPVILRNEDFRDRSLFSKLPIEIISAISLRLQKQDIINFRRTCRKVDVGCRNNVTSISVSSPKKAADLSKVDYRLYENLKKIKFDISLTWIIHVPDERKIQIYAKDRILWDNSTIISSRIFKRLEAVEFNYPYFEEYHLNMVATQLPLIKSLVLKSAKLENLLIHYSGGFSNLNKLGLKNCVISNESAIRLFQSMTKLIYLAVINCNKFSGKGLETVALDGLKAVILNLKHTALSQDKRSIVEFFFRSPLLEVIEVTSVRAFSNSTCDNFSKALPSSPLLNLKAVHFKYFDLNSECLGKMLSKTAKLKQLKVINTFAQPTDFHDFLIKWPDLVTLELGCSNLTDESFRSLVSSSKSLNKLTILSCENLTCSAFPNSILNTVVDLTLANLGGLGNGDLSALLNQLVHLQNLMIVNMPNITEIAKAPKLQSLKKLQLIKARSFTVEMIWKLLENSQHLEMLDFISTPISFALICKILEKFPHLKTLRLRDTSISQEQYNLLKMPSSTEGSAIGVNYQCQIFWAP